MNEYFLNWGHPSMSYNLYLSALLMAATCCSLMMAYLCFRRRNLPIAISYGLGMFFSSFYSFGYAFEIISTNLEHIRFWLRIEYVGILLGPVLFFIMVLQYTGRESWVKKRTVMLLLIEPVFTFIVHNTNEWHHLFYSNMTLNNSEGFPLVTLEKGPLYVVHVLYAYTLFAIGMIFLIRMLISAVPRMKKQIMLMIIGAWGPFGFTLVYLSEVFYLPIDISPFGFVISGVFYMWGIYQFNMLRIAPLALQKVFESMQDAVIVFDLDLVLTSFNRSAHQVIADLNAKSIGRSAAEVFSSHPELLEHILKPHTSFGKIHLSSQGTRKFFNVHQSFVNNSHYKPVGKMLLLSDITEAVLAEERLLDNARQLSELNIFKDRMFSVVAHDIRDPIALLVNLMELLEEEIAAASGDYDEIVQAMGQQIQNNFTLVESLLDWYRSQKEGRVFHPNVRDFGYAAEANLRMLLVHSSNKQIQMSSQIPPNTYIYADKEMLDLILRNLLSNAIKFTGHGGRIALSAELAGEYMVIAVRDTGEGISADQASTLLREEYPVSLNGTAGERGSGLGLQLCREFVQLHGGEIWFESIPGQGSTFFFSMPVLPNAGGVPPGSGYRQKARMGV